MITSFNFVSYFLTALESCLKEFIEIKEGKKTMRNRHSLNRLKRALE